jgi:hypothetical protein
MEELGKTGETLEREALASLKARAASWLEVSVKLGWFKKLPLQSAATTSWPRSGSWTWTSWAKRSGG